MTTVFDLLKNKAQSMERDLDNWLKQVKDQRDRIYELNYFTTPQILVLREELGSFKSCYKEKSMPIKPSVMNLLHSVSGNVTTGCLKKCFDKFSAEQLPISPSASITSPAAIVVSVVSDIPTRKKQEKKPKVPIRKVSIDTRHSATHPKFTKNDLTQTQLSHLYNLISAGYNRSLILLAFERCAATSSMLEDVSEWCTEHESEFEFSDDEGDDSNCDSESDNDSNVSEGNTIEMEHTEEEETKATRLNELAISNIETINTDSETHVQSHDNEFDDLFEVIKRTPLDENHPSVKSLNALGFEIDSCIQAVEKFPNNPSSAMDYIYALDEENVPDATAGKQVEEAEVEV